MKTSNNIKILTSTFLVLCIIALGINKLNYIVRPTDTDDAYGQIETFHSLPQNSVEVIIFGSSHAFRGFHTMELYEKYGIGAYNYGWNWQSISTTKTFVKDALQVQNPKVVLIETFNVAEVMKDVDLGPEVYYCRYLHDKEAKKDFFSKCLGENPSMERWLSYYLPLAMFHDNWNTLTKQSLTSLEKRDYKWILRNMGFGEGNEVSPVTIPDYQTFKQDELPTDALQELDDIVDECSAKGAEVILYTAPFGWEFQYHDALKNYATGKKCVYIDLFEQIKETGIDGNVDYADAGHLNTTGAIKVADYIGAYLVDHYELTDMRMIKDNIWEQQK